MFLESVDVLIGFGGGALIKGDVDALGVFNVCFLKPNPVNDSFALLTDV